jgi:RNA polymerase sigma factor (sigma-70 family)
MIETQLIQGCKENNRLAQKELYEKYKAAMYTLAYRITNDFEDANDVLQEAFVQVFRAIEQFRGESTIGAWIKTIVIRTAYRKVKQRVVFEDIDTLPDNSFVSWGTSLDTEYLEKAIQSLSEGYRTVFTLAEIEGFSHKEIASMMNISEGTSKSQLFYAKKRLREMLSETSPKEKTF